MEQEEREELLERAGFGKQIESFWSSRIGEYLQGRAEEEYVTGITDLKTADPQDWKTVQKLQNKVWLAERFKGWLSEAVIDGLKSMELLESGEE
jgi:hypothetical protein